MTIYKNNNSRHAAEEMSVNEFEAPLTMICFIEGTFTYR